MKSGQGMCVESLEIAEELLKVKLHRKKKDQQDLVLIVMSSKGKATELVIRKRKESL